jgi:hypothetical protein
MTIVAATAIGLGIAREMHDELWSQSNMTVIDGSVGAVLLPVTRWTVLSLPFLMAWTIALTLLQLLHPRPKLGDLFHRPGMTACGAATLAIAIGAVNLTALLVALRIKHSINRYEHDGIIEGLVSCLLHGKGIEAGMPGLAVTVGWIMLALSGRWQPDQSWLDRAGRWRGPTIIGTETYAKDRSQQLRTGIS